MSDISLTAAVRSNLLSLQGTASLMSETQNKLSTGNKVNTALDNPTNYFTASSLNSRAGDLSNLMDSMASGIKTIEAADNGLTSITKTLESMQSTLRQARQDKSFETASFNLSPSNVSLSSSSKLTLVGGAFGDSAPSIDLTTTDDGKTVTSNANYSAPATAAAAKQDGDVDIATNTGGVTGGSFSITYAGKTVSTTISAVAATSDASGAATEIQDAIDNSDLAGKLTVAVDGGTGYLSITAADNENSTIVLGGTQGTTNAAELFGTGANTAGSSGEYEFNINDTSITLDATTGADLDTAIDTINAELETDGAKFKAVKDGTGNKLVIQSATEDAGSLQITGTDADLFSSSADVQSVSGTATSGLTLLKTVDTLVSEINNSSKTKDAIKASNDDGKLRIQNLSTTDLTVQGTNESGKVTGESTDTSTVSGNSVRSGLADQFNELRDQLDKTADDASFNGINLLRGDNLKITFNETGTSSIDIQATDGKSIDSSNLGISSTLLASDLDSDDNIDGFLDQIKSALNSVRSQSSSFGSNLSVVENRQDFTKNMINTLETGAGNLTLADMNEEAANMVALQTRQSLATSSLSIANQADQSVLQILR